MILNRSALDLTFNVIFADVGKLKNESDCQCHRLYKSYWIKCLVFKIYPKCHTSEMMLKSVNNTRSKFPLIIYIAENIKIFSKASILNQCTSLASQLQMPICRQVSEVLFTLMTSHWATYFVVRLETAICHRYLTQKR